MSCNLTLTNNGNIILKASSKKGNNILNSFNYHCVLLDDVKITSGNFKADSAPYKKTIKDGNFTLTFNTTAPYNGNKAEIIYMPENKLALRPNQLDVKVQFPKNR